VNLQEGNDRVSHRSKPHANKGHEKGETVMSSSLFDVVSGLQKGKNPCWQSSMLKKK
jgi:hypothetical protein